MNDFALDAPITLNLIHTHTLSFLSRFKHYIPPYCTCTAPTPRCILFTHRLCMSGDFFLFFFKFIYKYNLFRNVARALPSLTPHPAHFPPSRRCARRSSYWQIANALELYPFCGRATTPRAVSIS